MWCDRSDKEFIYLALSQDSESNFVTKKKLARIALSILALAVLAIDFFPSPIAPLEHKLELIIILFVMVAALDLQLKVIELARRLKGNE